MPPSETWHLDKRVPLGIIFALLTQTIGVVWWVAKSDARLTALIAEDSQQERRLDILTTDMQAAKISMAQSSAQLDSIRETLQQLRQDQRETADLIRQALAEKSK